MVEEDKIVVYGPDDRRKIGFFKTWAVMLKNIVASRELILQLFKRDFLAVYKKSFLGIGWLFLSPVIGIISWVFMNAIGILKPGNVGIPYPAYVLLSSSIWGLFMGFYGSAAATLGAGAGFIMQVKYPHEILLAKQTAQHLASFLLGFTMNIIFLLFFKVVPSWKIIFFPFVILPLFFLGAGIGLIVSVINVVATDLQKAFDLLLGLVIYITPVIYSPKFDNPVLQKIIKWNPLTYLVGNVRDIIVYGKAEHWDRFFLAALLSLLIFLFSWRLFFISEDKVIEKMI